VIVRRPNARSCNSHVPPKAVVAGGRRSHTPPIESTPSTGHTLRRRSAGIKTFLIADVRGYTAFTQDRGDEAAAELARTFAEVVRAEIQSGGGTLVELRGDEALAVFDSARQAIRTAIELQLRLVAKTVADPRLPLAVGIGLDAGEAVAVDGGFRGGALNLAARLCSLAEAGEVLATREVTHLARKVGGVRYVERGPTRVKGLAEPVEVVKVRPELEDLAQDLAFRRALGPVASRATAATETRNPYKGLRAFEEADAADFFGREALTEHLVTRLAEVRFLAVVGPSGSGKSSVVRAGLVPAVRGGALPGSERWTIVEMFPGAYPLEELEAALLRVAENPPPSLLEQLRDEDGRGLVRAVKRVLPAGDSELLLVVDQLEELFTLVEDEERRARFLEVLERAVGDARSRLRVVTTLRADFYDRPLLYSGFAELLRDYVEALVPLMPDEFERAIAGPASRAGASLEAGLLAEMVADVATEPGALPLLQYALTELYERREGAILTRAAYHEIGGVSGALAGRAEEVFAGLMAEAQEAARQLFLRLVALGEGAEDTRRRVERTELAAMEVDQDGMEEAIEAFGSSRLLSFDRDPRTGTPTIEVAHEALLREWARLRRWIDSAREDVRLHRRLAAAAREWDESDRDPSFLLRGSHLAQFESWAADSRVALTGVEREFVGTSVAESRRELLRERRQNRRLKILLAGVAALLAVAVAAGIVALLQRQSAKHEATVALAGQLGAQSVIEPRIDRAVLLGHEAVNLDRSTQTEGALLSTLLRSPAAIGTFTFPIQARPLSAAVTPDGRTLAVADNQREIRFFDTRTHQETRAPLRPAGAFSIVGYSKDGSQLFTGGGEGQFASLEFLDSRTLKVVHRLQLERRLAVAPTTPIVPFDLTPDGRTFFLAYALLTPDGRDGPAYLDRWDVGSGKRTTIPLGSNGMLGLAVVRHGRELVTVTDSRITTLDARTLQPLHSVRQPVPLQPHPPTVGISPDGRTVAYGGVNGAVSFLDLASRRLTTGAGAHSGGIPQVVFSPDGREAVTTGDDSRVIVWDPRTAQPIEVLTGHGGRVTGVAFTRDSRTLFTTSLDAAVFEWDLGTQHRFGRPFVAGAPSPRLEGADYGPPPLAISPDGSRFAVRSDPSSVALVSTRSLRSLHRFQIDAGGKLVGLAWSSDGKLATTGADGHVQLWDVRRTPRLLRALKGLGSINGEEEVVTTATFSPDGRLLAAGDINHTPGATPYRYGTVAVWDVRSGKLLWKERTKRGWISAVPFSPDGKSMAAAREDGTVTIRDPRTGHIDRVLHTTGGGDFTYETAAFAPDGTLATGTWAGIVQLWNPNSGAGIGHPTLVAASPVATLSFGPKGETYATAGGSDGLAKLWTTKTQQQFGSTFPGDPGQWGDAAFTRDGSKLIVVYGDGHGFVWPVSTAAWERHACAVAGRNFTHEEWARYVGARGYSRVCSGFR
jgi:WD40 repeat protein/class 3 adenylate cyclase/energy-coupling factor transporter ATP-binding protein EcfA2